MSEIYELTRRIISRRTFKTMSAVRFRKSGGPQIYYGDTRIGYLTPEVRFKAAADRSGLTFGPNRSFAPNAHHLKSADGDLIAEIHHGLLQSAWGSKQFSVVDATGASLFELVPGKTLKIGSDQPSGARLNGELYAVRGEEILGHTGYETAAAGSNNAMIKATRRIGRIVAALPRAFEESFNKEVLGRSVEREDETVARFTLLESDAFEPYLIFAILMFKLHYYEMRGF